MKINYIKLSELKPYSKNAKLHTQEQIEKVANSIKRFGFIQPIVIDKNNFIIIGHCRFEASKIIPYDPVPCLIVDNLTKDEIKALRLADNKLNESMWNIDLAMEDLKLLSTDLINITSFKVDEVESYRNADKIDELSQEKSIDLGEYDVLTVEAPEAPRLKARVSFYTRNKEEFEKIKKFFDCKDGKLNIDKLIGIINE